MRRIGRHVVDAYLEKSVSPMLLVRQPAHGVQVGVEPRERARVIEGCPHDLADLVIAQAQRISRAGSEVNDELNGDVGREGREIG